MASNLPLMPKATAVWLIDNTSLTFKQIADFCGMHELEVKGIADGDVAPGIVGIDPIIAGQLTLEEIKNCEQNANLKLKVKVDRFLEGIEKKKKQTKYTPIARRQDKPDAIYWLVKNYPEIQDALVIKLIGTTKTTIEAIRNRQHWNMKNIRPRDPVLLGICTQIELNTLLESISKPKGDKSSSAM